MLLTLLHEALCLAILFFVFLRAVRLDSHTDMRLRLGTFALGLAACVGLARPLQVPGWQPDLAGLAMLSAVLVMLVATAPRWRDGAPEKFQTGAQP